MYIFYVKLIYYSNTVYFYVKYHIQQVWNGVKGNCENIFYN